MAKAKPEYEEVQEFASIANKLVQKFPDVFYGTDVSKVKCVAVINKERQSKTKVWEIKGVPMPIRMDCPYAYYLVIFMSDWNEMADKHRKLLVASALLSIPTDKDKEGQVNQFDLKDFDIMVRTFGIDYLIKDDVPDLIKEDIKWARND